jgi:hypothetical protein
MFVVAPPTVRDDVVVKMREAPLQAFDPFGQRLPLGVGIRGGDREPVRRPGQLVEVLIVVAFSAATDRLAQGSEAIGSILSVVGHPPPPLYMRPDGGGRR